MKVLLTAFEPFGGERINPAQLALQQLPQRLCGAEILRIELPVDFSLAAKQVIAALPQLQPDLVISLGQAGGRSAVTVERIAINYMCQPGKKGRFIDKNGTAAYFSTLPVEKMAAEGNKKAPTAVSNTAGTYVCNHVMYSVLQAIEKNHYPMQSGFIHVPYLPSQTEQKPNTPSMPLEKIVDALSACISAAVRAASNYTYIIECTDGTLYTGWTNDLQKRLLAHQTGDGAKYTKSHPAARIVYAESHLTKQEAMRREWQIKQLTHAEKLALAQGGEKR